MHDSSASGSILLTIEQRRVDREQQRRLAAASAAAPVYCPLKELRAVDPGDAGLRAIRDADVIVITSGFALSTYLAHPEWLDAVLRSPTLLLLSARMAAVAQSAGTATTKVTILTPPEENQRGVAALLAGMRYRHAVHLCGSLSVAHSALPDDVERVQIYENYWDDECESRACEAIDTALTHGPNRTEDADDPGNARQPDHNRRINRILVTSPSAYRRLRSIMQRIPQCFTVNPVYYTLGPSTTAAIEADGGLAVSPGSRDNVLQTAIERLLVD
ncbi:uroporphyrinogen-III synthase [Bifidobacterium callitrichos]|uniref:uroporphyrinogen-III synthase n=1 Tax=Bifidobacterium callitrichos TaxID=762209 RepID=UPI00168A75EF|nr:uroporphyrinogen-III synthase [Bifidobacterium callitrichos]